MSDIKNRKVTIKFAENDYLALQKMASNNNMSLSEYIRERVLFDDIQNKYQSFESKMLKGISFCVGFAQTFSNSKFSDQEAAEFEQEAKRIMISNGLDESMIKANDK